MSINKLHVEACIYLGKALKPSLEGQGKKHMIVLYPKATGLSLPFCFEQKAGHVGNMNKGWGDSRQAGVHIYDALSKIK